MTVIALLRLTAALLVVCGLEGINRMVIEDASSLAARRVWRCVSSPVLVVVFGLIAGIWIVAFVGLALALLAGAFLYMVPVLESIVDKRVNAALKETGMADGRALETYVATIDRLERDTAARLASIRDSAPAPAGGYRSAARPAAAQPEVIQIIRDDPHPVDIPVPAPPGSHVKTRAQRKAERRARDRTIERQRVLIQPDRAVS